ncbi:hypothetical protein B9Z55_013599 [Caenorhabditis nigoni]|uniref:Carboxylesterase type B domain-containing protein n=1 Tax=Caenorhabditis nigoni TaxID=1611254 RepID=A0A2G5U2G5_9PELO|nr:hypothetical protein B9Z55_013599 [Caenorhabditis nigoni]
METSLCQIIFFLALIRYSVSIIISTSSGKLNGKEVGDYHLFKKIPFAKPPLGELRFQKPEAVEKWDGIRNATEYGPACMSNSTVSKSPQKWVDEDCLHVNVFTSSKCLRSKGCAVVVCIHGGDILYGSAVAFNDTHLLNSFVKKGVILVIPAFRLGIFSHYVVQNQEISPTNLAFYDILQSLEYVKSEIHNFGGSNKKISLLGHSYGGSMITMLAFSPIVNQDLSLFQKIIVMSAQEEFETLEFQIEKTKRFVENANCSATVDMTRDQQDTYAMKCLQEKSGLELLRIQRSLEEAGYPPYGNVAQREPLFPGRTPSEFFDSPVKLPILTGCTGYEFDDKPGNWDLAHLAGVENIKECDEKYRKDVESGIFDRDNHTDETVGIMVSTKLRVDRFLEKGNPTFLYELKYPKHAFHVNDLYYILGLHPFEKDENENHIEKVYQTMVTNFAKFGNPGMGFEASNPKNSSYFEVNWNATTGIRPHINMDFEKKIMDYWLKDMREYDRKISDEKRRKSLKTRNLGFSTFEVNSAVVDRSLYFFFMILTFSSAFVLLCLYQKHCKNRRKYILIEGGNFNDFKDTDPNMIVY